MRIATYNVNGIGARLPRLLDYLGHSGNDIVVLQEIKCQTDNVPVAALNDAGWQVAAHGQKGFNGVAILARTAITPTQTGLPGDDGDEQARYLEAEVAGIRLGCLYLPNGNPQPGPKFDYKLAWMERLNAHAAQLLALETPTVLLGDYNVIPTDATIDIARPAMMANDALTQPQSRAAFRRLLAQGWTDAIRTRHPHSPCYTYWDYQAGAWQKNWGFRIDHLLLSPAAADRLADAGVDADTRGEDKASDHAPAWVQLRAAT
ncbi:exodeoxyribonuclease III [Sandaracinobacteroides saxicola]|uniref:Exodeoxyribonuclease III n=1 Tax=Sandaracinobacteroides saxicola TaxID=2759707 RepID=A0A7G5IKK1_9SPHN|nr:exodeoxyribonuclease III [Sandaracinobacteroides saxicola]QMW23893.1 exodeoxyribonuclease III [Sandaracinobacteroides saxicola]